MKLNTLTSTKYTHQIPKNQIFVPESLTLFQQSIQECTK